jgi:ankyrin repeat protein
MSEFTDAIRAGDVDRVRSLVAGDPSLSTSREQGTTPILLAIYNGKPDVARALVEAGAPVSFPEACALGDAERAEAMLAADPSVLDVRSEDGFPPVGLAIFFGHGALARRLIERGADVNAAAQNPQRVTPLHAAAAVRDLETTRVLLARGADVHARQQADYTPLHGAASRGDRELAQLLLDHGARPDAQAADGLTPAGVARKYGHPELAGWLDSLS